MTNKYHAIKLLLAVIILASLIVAIPVYAYSYSAPISISYNGTSTWSMLPIIIDSDNEYMSDNGFMASSGNDTRVQDASDNDKPYCIADNKTLTAIPILPQSQNNLFMTTGNSDWVTQPMIFGYGGYFTVADNATLELGDNFSVNMTDTFINGSGLVFSKSNAIAYSDSNNVTFTLTSSVNSNYETGLDTWEKVYAANWRGQTFTLASDAFVTHVDVWGLRLSNAGDSTAYLETVSADVPTGTVLVTNSIASSSWSTGTPAWYPVAINQYLEAGTYAIVWSSPTSDVSNCPEFGRDSGGASYTGGQYVYSADSGSSWTASATSDLYIRVYIASGGVTTALDNAAHDYAFAADSTNLTLMKDGASVSSVALSGASVTDDSSNWVFGSDATPYIGSVSISVNGTTLATYAPVSMIIGTNLPNNTTTGSYNGTITWGTNPDGITAVLGALVSGTQPSPGAVTTLPSPDLLQSNAGGTNWFGEPDETALHDNPFYMVVKYTSETGGLSTFTEAQVWRFFGIWFVLILTVAAAIIVRGHLLIASVICCAAIWFMVHLTIFPMVILVALIPILLVGLVMERSPSV